MQVIRKRKKANFIPIVLEITLETPEEAGALFSICNHANIVQCCEKFIDLRIITQALKYTTGFDYTKYFYVIATKLKGLIKND